MIALGLFFYRALECPKKGPREMKKGNSISKDNKYRFIEDSSNVSA